MDIPPTSPFGKNLKGINNYSEAVLERLTPLLRKWREKALDSRLLITARTGGELNEGKFMMESVRQFLTINPDLELLFQTSSNPFSCCSSDWVHKDAIFDGTVTVIAPK